MNRVSVPGAPSIDHLYVYVQTRSITTSMFAQSRLPCVPPNSLDYGLPVYLETPSITASKCISKLGRLRPAISLYYSLQVHLQTCSITTCKIARHGLQGHISKLAWSRPSSVSHNSLDNGLHMCISPFPQSRSRSVSLSSLNYHLQVYVQIRLITTPKCISKVTRSLPWTVTLNSLDCYFQAHLELVSRYDCSQSRYTVCRSVAF